MTSSVGQLQETGIPDGRVELCNNPGGDCGAIYQSHRCVHSWPYQYVPGPITQVPPQLGKVTFMATQWNTMQL